MLREIIIWPDPKLTRVSAPVGRVDGKIQQLMDDMLETMHAAHGVGLAAPQIGEPKRVIVIDVEEGARVLRLANPVIVELSAQKIVTPEGCLSIPGEVEDVERAVGAKVRALNYQGAPVFIEATGLLAAALQHEIEHLDGILYVDHLSSLKRHRIRQRMAKLKR